MLEISGLRIRFGAFQLYDIDLRVDEGAYFVLLGPSGAGKTLLLETIAGFHRLDAGTVCVGNQDVSAAPMQQRNLGFVFQAPSLFPHLTVRRNIGYGLRARRTPSIRIGGIVDDLAKRVGVESMLGRKPATLSGGQAQRVALARALATSPKCLLLDEPLSALDPEARSEMRTLLRNLHRDGQTVLHVTHDYEEAIALATHVGVIENGAIVETGTPRDVFQHPKSPFTARFIGIRNFFPGDLSISDEAGATLGVFRTKNLQMTVLTDTPAGPGFLILRSEDVSLSEKAPHTSAQNTFLGKVTDVAPARLGVEVVVDIGVEIAAIVTPRSVETFHLSPGDAVWVSFKASAARIIPS